MGFQVICISVGNPNTPPAGRAVRVWPQTPDNSRATPRHRVKVPTFSAKPHAEKVIHKYQESDALAIIDTVIDIANAIANGNGDPVEKAVDAACLECSMILTPTTRANVISYLKS